MSPQSRLKFELVNGVTESDISSNKYVIYAHSCSSGMYVGLSEDPVKRWQEHWSDAFNPHCENYTDKFRVAIRENQNNFHHYILQVDNTERSAKNKEAQAISYYSANLNIRDEVNFEHSNFGYKPLNSQFSTAVFLEKKSSTGSWYSRGDESRSSVIAEVIFERGRKRLRSIGCKNFNAGLMVECSREERGRFEEGDLVIVEVALSTKHGKEYLVAAKYGRLKLTR